MQPSTRARATPKHDAEDKREDEAEENVEKDDDNEEAMESENPPEEDEEVEEVYKKPSSNRAAKKAKAAPKKKDYPTSSLKIVWIPHPSPIQGLYMSWLHDFACIQELKPNQFDLDVKAINEGIPDPDISVPEAVIVGEKKCCS